MKTAKAGQTTSRAAKADPVANRLALVAFLTDDYDRAIAWFCDVLRFELLEDTDMGGGKRWVRMAPTPDADTAFLIAKATGAQAETIGKQAGGRVGHFLFTDDFDAMAAHMKAQGVTFREAPRDEPYGKVVVFEDLHGNPWDLMQPKP
ncbi:VOC family protein [Aliiroseovarius sp. Z3]|uniref:VOC family protein n=1 Tax=Aliiroseovarius sp. Z3 TaxID=2811402 RepID=UPI0023B2CB90|nr:VOC family protein [Aliiroseovarius sp. Z3]MDE9448960.1 VOC family protein [Aliiroseovarius sp. Z3]